jgi:hypothetical protein
MYLAVPSACLVLAAAFSSRRVLIAAPVLLLIATAASVTTIQDLARMESRPGCWTEFTPPSMTTLERTLDRLHIARAYANYWIAYRLTYHTDERIIASPYDTVRNPALDRKVAKSRTPPAYIFFNDGSNSAQILEQYVRRLGAHYRRTLTGHFVVYQLTTPVPPWQIPEIALAFFSNPPLCAEA